MRVLIGDDSRLIRERIIETLSLFDDIEIVGETENGSDTLSRLVSLRPDLAILDIRMPGKSGLDVIREYRKVSSETKIIVLSNYTNDQYLARAFEYGADYFFSKSDDFDKLGSLIGELIRYSKP